ncbi:MAG: MopE-related protein [Polyangiales bacterium]
MRMAKHTPLLFGLLSTAWLATGCSIIVDGQLDDAPREVRCEEEPDGTECGDMTDGIRRVCLSGTCRLSQCGDGYTDTENGEECDDDDDVAGDGCEPSSCLFSCKVDADCDDGNLCTGAETCDLATHTCMPGTPGTGTPCTQPDNDPGVCNMGLCVPEGCGDGVLDGEECDDGNLFDNDGCDSNCTFSCTADADCDDGDLCTGTETCNLTEHVCVPGTPEVCPDAPDACHVQGTCQAGVGCPAPNDATLLIDLDGDGYAATALGACGTDCNDGDDEIHPGHPEVCGDGKDNNCENGQADEAVVTWYADCDGDDYALSGATTRMLCNKPPTDAASTGCPDGNGDWTTRNPNSAVNRDCADHDSRAHPGAYPSTDRSTWPTSAIPGTSSWDWNCDGTWERAYQSCTSTFCCFIQINCNSAITCCGGGTYGWVDGTEPGCGTSEYYELCGNEASNANCPSDEYRLQRCR